MPEAPATRAGGRILVDALRIHGVDRMFCVPGESYLEVLDALYDTPEIALIVAAKDQPRDLFLQACNMRVLHVVLGHGKSPSEERRVAKMLRFFRIISQADRFAPAVQRAHIAKRVLPAHRWIRRLPRAGQDRATGDIGFVCVAGHVRFDENLARLSFSFAMHDDSAALRGCSIHGPRMRKIN